MKIAITGATGFLGKYLVKQLKKKYEILVIARQEENAQNIFNEEIDIYECSYELEELKIAFEEVDIIIHLAAKTLQKDSDPFQISQFYSVNIQLLENVLLAAKTCNVKKIVQISSNNVYSSDNKLPFTEDQIPVPSSIYGLSKLYSEQLGTFFSSKTSLKVVCLRLARIFGYGERDSVVFTKYMKLAVQKKQLEIWGEGKTGIDYLYVRDAVEAIEHAIPDNIQSGIYNVGANRAYMINEIAETINAVCNNEGNIFYDKSKQEGGYFIKMDSTKYYNMSSWSPKWSLKEAIKEMFHYYKKNE